MQIAGQSAETGPWLTVKGLKKRFGGVVAADNVSFSLAGGEILGLVGPNGSGKSTVFNMITGGLKPDEGSIEVAGIPVVGKPVYKIARLGLARTFQGIKIFRELTLRQNLALSAQGQSLKNWQERGDDLVRQFNLTHLTDTVTGGLSIGQQRLVEIAMQLLGAPNLLLLDEPLAGVHPTVRAKIAEILAEQRSRGAAILLIEHDMSFIMKCCDRIIALDQGAIIAEGSPDLIKLNDRVLSSLLGAKPVGHHVDG